MNQSILKKGINMKEITIQDFTHLTDAIDFLENILYDAYPHTGDIDGEIKLINGRWRVGVTINGRQAEFNFEESRGG